MAVVSRPRDSGFFLLAKCFSDKRLLETKFSAGILGGLYEIFMDSRVCM